MGIRWGRGFFRLWAIFAVLWVAAAVWIDTRPPPPGPWDRFADLPFPRTKSACEAAAKLEPTVNIELCLENASIQNWRDAEKVAWIIAPPIIILFFGGAVGWAVRGFKL
jgi:hypothetical protein